jgi:hypothetical protein
LTQAARTTSALYLDLIRRGCCQRDHQPPDACVQPSTADLPVGRPAGCCCCGRRWLLLLWLWIAADGFPGWHLLAVFVLGTILMRSAGCCVNDVADREFDRHVKRTAQRPVTRGALSVRRR